MPLSPFAHQLWLHDKQLINNRDRWNEIARRMAHEQLMEIIDVAARYKCRFLPLSKHPAIKHLCKRPQGCFSTSIHVGVQRPADVKDAEFRAVAISPFL